MTRSCRLLFMLLTLLIALPAMQARACDSPTADHATHGMSMQVQMLHHGDHGRAPDVPSPAKIHHNCIGCVAPIDIKVYLPAELAIVRMERAESLPKIFFLIGAKSRPELRPPRLSN